MKFCDVIDYQYFTDPLDEELCVYQKVPFVSYQMSDTISIKHNAKLHSATLFFKDNYEVEIFVDAFYELKTSILELLKNVQKCREIHTMIPKCDKCKHYDSVQKMIERIESGS